jgi:HNH endonuclease
MSRRKISAVVQLQVREQANFLCEFCHAAECWQYVRFTVDHVIPISLGGSDYLDNLALACFHCNRQKTNRSMVVEPNFGVEVALFNPRGDIWSEHFIWSADGLQILGLTATGRATVAALDLNRERVLAIRQADLAIGRHPPEGDRVQGR